MLALFGSICTDAQQPEARIDSLGIEMQAENRAELPVHFLNSEDLELDKDDGGKTFVSSILTAGRDPFLSAAAFNFSPVRFRLRGYESQGNSVYLNGIRFNGLDNGFIPFGLWSGLNNAMRNQQNAYGLQPNEWALGSLALNTFIDMRAGVQRPQTQINYAISNRTYRHRLMYSHSSGFDRSGWAYSLALTGRYGGEGYMPGTYYESGSIYMGIDKKIKERNIFSIIAFGAPTEAGRAGAAVEEARELAGGNRYNPSWGWQNGQQRSANVLQAFQPVIMASYDSRINEKSNIISTAAYVFGHRKISGLDWYNAPDPRPDYYRYLPSYYAQNRPALFQKLLAGYKADPDALQIQWDRLYTANTGNIRTIANVDGIAANAVTGKRSVYILSNRVNNSKRFLFSSIYNSMITDMTTITTGVHLQQQINHYYQEVGDLLGGDFWVNINQFAERDYPNDPNAVQYDLNRPNRIIKKGEVYGYNYKTVVQQALAWVQILLKLPFFDTFLGGEVSHTGFYRDGLNRNGLFPDLSYGKSEIQNFLNPAVKAGITYKMNGRNYFFLNGSYRSVAPFSENAFISQRTRNTVLENLKSETFTTYEAGYRLNTPRIRLGVTGFYTRSADGTDVLSFYHDQHQNFVNYALSGISKVYFGIESGAEIKLSSTVSFNSAVAIGRYYYDSRQQAIITVDNSAELLGRQTVYFQNYRIPSTPQNAYSAGIFYRSPQYWYISLTGNYFSDMWLSPNPIRRTGEAIADSDPANPADEKVKKSILAQEKLEPQFTLDFFGGWSRLLPARYYIRGRRTYVFGNLGISNLLNNDEIISGGFEQLRFDFEEKNADKFPPKYYYAYGLNFFASIGIRF